ncbi:GGDEF domain-containing protein [Methylotetracoccus oryzae]|uniref:GGDEF domain-containing protein n=1 Tax=Methylotetracoccus oryzae TaxID=1919059 RepID=UPI0011192384|nr:GGDEF domain-containing protein [Methylotetracoccus oryzae]
MLARCLQSFMNLALNLDVTRRWVWSLLAIAMLAVTVLLDLVSGAEFTFALFYAFPVLLLASSQGIAVGILVALAVGGAWFYVDYTAGRHALASGAYVWSFFSRWVLLALLAMLTAALKSSLAQQAALARTDPLAGLLNGRAFRRAAGQEIIRSGRYQRPLTFAFLDLDNFKAVNDSFGHRCGDELLRRIGAVLAESVQRSDLVGRLGGDEFGIVSSECGPDEARAASVKVRNAVWKVCASQRAAVAVSVGVVTYTAHSMADSVDTMIEQGDRLIYEVKSGGKDGIRYQVVS